VRPLRLIAWALFVALVVLSVAAYDQLPSQIPMRMSLDGVPSKLVTRSWVSWMALPGVALLVQLLLDGLASILPRYPQLFNFSNKRRFLALPRELHAPVIAEMRLVLDVVALFVQGTMVFTQLLLWQVAVGTPIPNAGLAIPIGSIVLVPVVLLLSQRVDRAVERQEALHRGRSHAR
jgi:uncharacterized membrane protein